MAVKSTRRSELLAFTALLGALSIVLSSIHVPIPPTNPNLGSTPVSLSGVTTPFPVPFFVGIIKGLGISLWTGQVSVELPAGIGDGIMALFTFYLARRIHPVGAVVAGQISRYIFTSGMIALSLTSLAAMNPNATGTFTGNFIGFWLSTLPGVTLSIVANTLLSVGLVIALKKLYPSIFARFLVPRQKNISQPVPN